MRISPVILPPVLRPASTSCSTRRNHALKRTALHGFPCMGGQRPMGDSADRFPAGCGWRIGGWLGGRVGTPALAHHERGLAGARSAHERSQHPRPEGAADALEQQQLASVGPVGRGLQVRALRRGRPKRPHSVAYYCGGRGGTFWTNANPQGRGELFGSK